MAGVHGSGHFALVRDPNQLRNAEAASPLFARMNRKRRWQFSLQCPAELLSTVAGQQQ
jgi:hypothetical protein